MHIAVVTLFPEWVQQVGGCGITGRALKRGLMTLSTHQPRDYTTDRHRTVDDRVYGGGPGMAMRAEPLAQALQVARAAVGEGARVVHLSPQGVPLTQALVQAWSQQAGLVLLCSRYEGVDERLIEQEVDLEVSIGDYVLSGGELPAMVVVDALARLLPGALQDAESAAQDSFSAGLLDHPHYTRGAAGEGAREQWRGQPVPEVLLSGDHAAIARWRLRQALGRTWLRRPDLLDGLELDETQRKLLRQMIEEYVVEATALSPEQ